VKSIRFIDRPKRVTRASYEDAVNHVVDSSRTIPGLLSIYRFGNINTPGISDIDLLFVFEGDRYCPLNGLESLPDTFSSLFTHGIMAMKEEHFEDNFRFTVWSKADCIWGKQLPNPQPRSEDDTLKLNRQTAVEFLMANYIDFSVQSTYRVVKLRSLLQHMKGIAYDMELLGINESPIHPQIELLRSMIAEWFEKTPQDAEVRKWISSFSEVFPRSLQQILQEHPLILPESSRYTIASNMTLASEERVKFMHSGWVPSPLFSFAGRNYFKLLHRFNRFKFTCPIRHEAEGFLTERFRFLQRMKAYNREHLPNFMTMTPSINAKLI
jgi:hypothetical protein